MFLQEHEASSGALPRAAGGPTPAVWHVLAYLAGDNDLEDALLDDLREMERVGSRAGEVEIVAQVDRARGARRYYVRRAAYPDRIASKLLADLGEINTGDPRVLQAFVSFAAGRYPAQATLLILSNHGSGFYVPPSVLSKRRRPLRQGRHGFFQPTREWLQAPEPNRGIAYDDGSADCLDNRELTRAMAHAHRVLGRPVDVVGMDACLMTMLEVAYQLREHARILVGSEEIEPEKGWPYTAVLGDLTARPAMTGAELAESIVRLYVESYAGRRHEATQSAIDLGRLDEVVEAVDALARALLAAMPDATLEAQIYGAWRRTLRFFDHLYVDLHHFAVNLAATVDRSAVRQACAEIGRALSATPGPILANAHVGRRMAAARGLSIYFPPFRDPSIFYRQLAFAQRTRWADFLDAYLGKGKER